MLLTCWPDSELSQSCLLLFMPLGGRSCRCCCCCELKCSQSLLSCPPGCQDTLTSPQPGCRVLHVAVLPHKAEEGQALHDLLQQGRILVPVGNDTAHR